MIKAIGLRRVAGGTTILDDVDLEVEKGEFVALLGPSGSGKSTLLRIIAGLDTPDGGELFLDGHPAIGLPPGKRGIGLVSQAYSLFEHMPVARNIAFGLEIQRPRPPRATIDARVEEMLSLIRLQGLGPRLPAQLSGGQRQRVALARTLAVSPRILLLDEPFGALDRDVRQELRREVRSIHEQLGMTTLLVTHDPDEADAMADRSVHLAGGRLA